MQVLYGDTVRAILQKPGYRGFYEQHVLQQEIFSWMITRRPIPSRTWLSDVLGFVEGITKDYAHVSHPTRRWYLQTSHCCQGLSNVKLSCVSCIPYPALLGAGTHTAIAFLPGGQASHPLTKAK